MIDGAEDDGVAGDMDDDTAACEVGDDFVFLGWRGGDETAQRREKCQEDTHETGPLAGTGRKVETNIVEGWFRG